MSSTWPPFDVTSSAHKLTELRGHLEEPLDSSGKTLPSEIIGWLSRVLIVRACGHLEQVLKACTRGYIEQRSGGPLRTFGLSHAERFKNPSRDNLVELLSRFDPGWGWALEQFLDDDDQRLHRDLASAVDKRNRIAHGENEGANRDQALRLCDGVLEISNWLQDRLRP